MESRYRASSVNLEQLNKQCLSQVNELRSLVSAPPLRLRMNLILGSSRGTAQCRYNGAQDWAVRLAKEDRLLPDATAREIGIGESVCRVYTEQFCDFSGEKIINHWFYEAIEANPGPEPSYANSQNFLQMVWAKSQYCGFGMAYSAASSCLYMVARYKPAIPSMSQVEEQLKKATIASSGEMRSKVERHLSEHLSYTKFTMRPENSYTGNSRNPLPAEMRGLTGQYKIRSILQHTTVSDGATRRQRGWLYVGAGSDMMAVVETNDF